MTSQGPYHNRNTEGNWEDFRYLEVGPTGRPVRRSPWMMKILHWIGEHQSLDLVNLC